MTREPANSLPATTDVGPDEPVVTFVMDECRVCGDRSSWVRSDHGAPHTWDGEHEAATGHSRFYVWSVTRSTARVFRL